MSEKSGPLVVFAIEDDEDDRVLLLRQLEILRLAKGTFCFSSAMELVDYCDSHKKCPHPSIILLSAYLLADIRQAVAMIRWIDELQTVPIVVVVGSRGEEQSLRSQSVDVSGYAVKPVNIQELIDEFGK